MSRLAVMPFVVATFAAVAFLSTAVAQDDGGAAVLVGKARQGTIYLKSGTRAFGWVLRLTSQEVQFQRGKGSETQKYLAKDGIVLGIEFQESITTATHYALNPKTKQFANYDPATKKFMTPAEAAAKKAADVSAKKETKKETERIRRDRLGLPALDESPEPAWKIVKVARGALQYDVVGGTLWTAPGLLVTVELTITPTRMAADPKRFQVEAAEPGAKGEGLGERKSKLIKTDKDKETWLLWFGGQLPTLNGWRLGSPPAEYYFRNPRWISLTRLDDVSGPPKGPSEEPQWALHRAERSRFMVEVSSADYLVGGTMVITGRTQSRVIKKDREDLIYVFVELGRTNKLGYEAFAAKIGYAAYYDSFRPKPELFRLVNGKGEIIGIGSPVVASGVIGVGEKGYTLEERKFTPAGPAPPRFTCLRFFCPDNLPDELYLVGGGYPIVRRIPLNRPGQAQLVK